MSGHVGDLSAKQSAILEQFKVAIKDVIKPDHDDHYLLRWLRARSWDLKKAEKMIRDSLEWRRKYGADTIVEDWTPPEVLMKYYPGGLAGFDNDGCPIWIDTLGYVDLNGMMYSVRKADIIRYKVWWIEKIFRIFTQQTTKLGKQIDQCSMVFDMEKINMKFLWKPAVETFIELLKTFEANYPETLKTCYVLNAPRIFPIAYHLVKPFLSEDTKRKIQVIGGNWKDVLLKDIQPDQLPVHWGGTLSDPDGDEYCRSYICMGGQVPESMFIQKENFIDMSNFTKTSVGRGSSLQLDFDVKESGYILSWQFWTEGNDIGFGIFRRTLDSRQKAGEMEEVIPAERVNSHLIPESGEYTCEKPGTYVLRFDNTYSWVTAKTISYFVEILEPDDCADLKGSEIITRL